MLWFRHAKPAAFPQPSAVVIAVVNQKGGVGKTTTAVNLSACLAKLGRRVLLVDLDPQANATIGLGVEPRDERGVYSVLTRDDFPAAQALTATPQVNLELMPAGLMLSGADLDLANRTGREMVLKRKLSELLSGYDFILIDCSPSLSLLTVNALVAADEVLIPIQAHYLALEGMKLLFKTIQIIKDRINPGLAVMGILPTLYDRRLALCREVLDGLRNYFGARVLRSAINVNSKLAEAPSSGRPIHLYAPRSRGAKDYHDLAQEVLSLAGR